MFNIFWRYYKNSVRHYFQSRTTAKVITSLLFIVLFIIIGLGVMVFFQRAILFIKNFPYLEQALILYAFELFYLAIAYLVFLNALISGLFTFFRRNLDNWFMASPAFPVMAWYIFVKTSFMSLWPLVVLVVPALLGIRKVIYFRFTALFLIIFSAMVLVLLAVFLALTLLWGLIKLINYKARPIWGKLITILCLIIALISYSGWLKFRQVDLIDFFNIENLTLKSADISKINNEFKWLPSHLAASISFNVVVGNQHKLGFYFIELLAWFLLGAFLFKLVASFYLSLWQRLQEGRFVATASASLPEKRALSIRFPHFFKGQIGTIFEKEILVMLRDMRNFLWSLFLISLWFIQIVLNGVIKKHLHQAQNSDMEMLLKIMGAVQLIIVIYFVSAFVLRFVLPAFSMERKTAWILASAPIDFRKIFIAKLVFFGLFLTLLGVCMSVANAFILGVPILNLATFVFIIVPAIWLVVAFGLALGAIYPNFETDDPQIISTSLTGLGFVLGSLIYGAITALLYYKFLNTAQLYGLIIFIPVSLISVFLLSRKAMKNLGRIEFTN